MNPPTPPNTDSSQSNVIYHIVGVSYTRAVGRGGGLILGEGINAQPQEVPIFES